MKRTFLKVLPFAAALLLATSCSKDDNNSTDEIVNNGGEQIETVVKTFKTLTVKGKVNKSISKVTTNQDETALAFEGNEVFAFGSNTDDVYGTINFTNVDGSYTATINYTDETVLSGNFTATLGTNPATISAAYDDLAAAVKNAYYTIDFTITQNEGEYKLKSGDASDIVVNLQSAFIKALAGNTEKLGGEDITVEKGKYYIVPVGKTMGETQNTTIAGKIYTIKAPDYLPGVFTVDAAGKKVKFSKGNLQYHCTNQTWRFAEHQWDYIGSDNSKISADYDGYIDLFGWGTWLEGGNPVNKSTTNGDYTWDNSKVSAFGSEWTTLTSDEWTYLFNTRSTTSKVLYAKAEVNGVNGVILLPDNWSSETTLQNTNSISAAFTTNTINATKWSTLESAGAVFLPAAGGRSSGTYVYSVGNFGIYWSSTAYGKTGAHNLNFSSNNVRQTFSDRNYGFSVRPVRVQN